MSIQVALFYIFSSFTVLISLFLLFTRNIVHAAFAFLGVLLGIAIVFVYLNAEFVAVSHIMIYVGGVLVLLIFGVMLTNAVNFKAESHINLKNVLYFIMVILFTYIIVSSSSFVEQNDIISAQQDPIENGSISQKVGYLLITKNIVAFEATGVLLLVALVGAASVIGRK